MKIGKMSNKGLVNFLWVRTCIYGIHLKKPCSKNLLDECEKDAAEAKKEILSRMRKTKTGAANT